MTIGLPHIMFSQVQDDIFPRNVSKNFQKDISSRTKDIKQFSQLIIDRHTDRQTDGQV